MFQGAKVCTNSDKNDPACKGYPIKSNKPYKVDGKYASGDAFSTAGRIVLPNSSYLLIRNYPTCQMNFHAVRRDEQGHEIESWDTTLDNCAIIYIDSNGSKGPNQFGADIYRINLKSDGTLEGTNSNSDINKVIATEKVEYTKYKLGADVE